MTFDKAILDRMVRDADAAVNDSFYAADVACDVKALAAEVERLTERHNDIVKALYGQGLDVVGYHLNGDLEPLDTWFEDNNWIDSPVAKADKERRR